jgi:RNA polymerase sigma factor (sigma-70 family)
MMASEFTNQLVQARPNLRALTYRFTRDPEESSDLVQDTILKALMYKDKFRENRNLKGWLFTIMRNTFINKYRKNQHEAISRGQASEVGLLNAEDTHTFNGPGTSLEYHDVWGQVNTIREELLVPFKMHLSGYKYQEIAEHQNIPIGTVKNRIFHARKEIQKKLQG